MLPAAASSSPKHARTGGFLESWPFHFILLYRRRVGSAGGFILCFTLFRFKRWAWPIVASTQRDGNRWKWAASDWAEKIRRNRSHAILSDLWNTCWRLPFRVTRVKHAWSTEAKGQGKLHFFHWWTRQSNKRDNAMPAKRTWDGARRANPIGRGVARWAKIECTSYTKLMPTSWM